MRPYLFTLFLITGLALTSQAFQCRLNNYQTLSPVSETRQIYIEKTANIEYYIAAINSKWNWISSIPAEDSIANAQGWYTLMTARLDELKKELVAIKIEQLQNYYRDILDLYSGQETTLNAAIKNLEENRLKLAPNYSIHEEFIPLSNDFIILGKWINDYPQEYLDFTMFFEKIIISQ